jgi:protein TonB
VSAVAAVSFRAPVLAWSASPDDDARFRRIQQRVLGVCLLLALILPWVPAKKPDPTQVQELPPRLVKLLLEREPVPLPKPETKPLVDAAKPAVTEPTAAKPQPQRPEKSQPLPKAVAPEARNPIQGKPPGEVLDGVRRKAAGVGLLAMKNELAELRGAPLAVQLQQDIKAGPGVGTGVGVGVGAGAEPGLPARSLITSNVAGGSGGINTTAYSRDTGGGGLAGRATTLVEGKPGGGGGGGPGEGGARNGTGPAGGRGANGPGGTLQRGGSGKASRSIEEIKLVFERNKGAIYAIYNRALREEPSLQGKVVVELKIAPSGEVIDCRIVSSELNANELERKLLARIRQFDFGSKNVDQMVVTWPVDFLPS